MNVPITVISTGFTFPGPSYGQYKSTGPDGDFVSWCAERLQHFRFGQPVEYTLLDGVEAWGSAISTNLDHLFSAFPTITNSAESMRVQEQAWSILAGSAPSSEILATPVTHHAQLLHNTNYQDLIFIRPLSVDEPMPALLLVLGLSLITVWRMLKWK